VIFARRQNARRGEGGPAALAGAVTRSRDGGDCLVAGAGERRCGGGPRRASPNAKAAGLGRRPQRRDSPLTPATYGGTLACPPLSSADPCAHAQSLAGAGRPGAPKACHLLLVKKLLTDQAILSCSSPKSAMSLRVPPRAAT
jgi:hypothetical protein